MASYLKLASASVVLLLLGVAFQPAVAELYRDDPADGSRFTPFEGIPGPFRELDKLVARLMAATPMANRTDSDNDTIYDNVEWVIGTDPDRADSDFDLLTDMEEVINRTDPMTPDSNKDGILDVHEVRDGISDLDGDGVPNAWDSDNDGDGLTDARDLCPFTKTSTESTFHLDINTSGSPAMVHFQIRTQNPNHMRLSQQVWDWPDGDLEGRMRDLDGSSEDLTMVPILELSGDGMPSGPELADLGIMTNEGKAYLSLTPMWEYGNIVALQGQMLFPSSDEPQNLSFDAELIWRVTGRSDKWVNAYRMGDGRYLTVGEDGSVLANATGTSDTELFELVNLEEGRIALKTWNGLYLALRMDGTVTASSLRIQHNEVFTPDGDTLKARNGKYLTVGVDGSIVAEATSKAAGSTFEKVAKGTRPESTILAAYRDPFYMTGLAIEESHGTDVAVIYNNQSAMRTLATNLHLAYQFLRNETNNITDIPQLLADVGADMEVVLELYNRTDEAGRALTGHMYADAAGTFPEGANMPIIAAMQMRTVYTDLTLLSRGGYQVGAVLAADLTAVPLIEKKMMKTDWYNSSSTKAVEIETIVEEMSEWDVEPEELSALISLVVAWNHGEEEITRYGGEAISTTEPEWTKIVGIVKEVLTWGPVGWDLLSKTLFAAKVATAYAYLLINNIPSFLTGLLEEGVKWGVKVAWNSVKAIKDVSSQVGSLTKGLMGVLKTFNKVMEVVGVIAAVVTLGIDVVMAGVTWYTIASAYGFSAMGIYAATVSAVLTVAWSVFNFAFALLALMPLVGWIFALGGLLLTLGDYLGYLIPFFGKSFSQWAIEAIVDLLTDVKELTMVDLSIINQQFTINDKDFNGLDAGDRITYETTVRESVQNIGDSDDSSIRNSYIHHELWIKVPYKSKSKTNVSREVIGIIDDFMPEWYAEDVSIEGWVEPGMAYVNFPFTFGFNTSYRVYREERFWIVVWITQEKATSDVVRNNPQTVYFDVMPGTVDDFASWKEIKAMDSDGDGINDTEETGSNPMKWDSDGDGLGDSFELQIGSEPNKQDTDADGMNDMDEYLYGSDIHDEDTDGDGIFDSIEYAGWVVTFTYEGVEFDWHINSDLKLNDTDGDELNDHFEYLTLQNPRSKDTDGDGVKDAIRDYSITEFDLRRQLSTTTYGIMDVVVDGAGYMYATAGDWGIGFMYKYAPDGTLVDTWTLGGVLKNPIGIAMDEDGALFVCNSDNPDHAVVICDTNGTVIDTWAQDTPNDRLIYPNFLALDAEGYVYVSGREMHTVEKYAPNGTFVTSWGGPGNGAGQFSTPAGVAVDDDGFVYVVDRGNARVQKFDADGNFVRQWGSYGTAPGQFMEPSDIAVDDSGDLIVGSTLHDGGYSRLQKFDHNGRYITQGQFDSHGVRMFAQAYGLGLTDDTVVVADAFSKRLVEVWHNVTIVPANPVNEFLDTDGDGLFDDVEESGWSINITDMVGPRSIDVDSDPLLPDTDGDTINDTREFELGSDPRSVDTDGDGVSDPDEELMGTNISNWDTDGDGLDDGIERTYSSDPLLQDTDGEGLTDHEEFLLGSNPNRADTDDDGLDDAEEDAFGSSPLDPDSDNDMMVDSRESDLGTLPNVEDFDGDGLKDGYEDIFDTNATNGDSDGDSLSDGVEISMGINPLSNDTDGDGLTDSAEMDVGLNPRSADSDGDGVPDLSDTDYEVSLEGTIYVVVDTWNDTSGLVERLSAMTDVIVVTPGELLSDHSDARYVVIIGDPGNAEGTAGSLVRDLLLDCPDILDGMIASEENHIAIRYGKWAPVQTIIMLSRTYPSDHYRVMGILKSVTVKVTDGALSYDYLAPRSFFMLDDVDTFKATGSRVWTKLDEPVLFSVDLASYSNEDTPNALTRENGLAVDEMPTGKYLEIEVSEDLKNDDGDLITGATIWMYYTVDDLDVNGDGDAEDPIDIDETTLALFVLDVGTGNWVRLTPDLEWVNDTGLETADLEMYGVPYAGFLWAEVSHLSLFSAGGRMRDFIATTARPGPDVTVDVDEIVTFDGSASEGNGGIVDFTWTFEHEGAPVTLKGSRPSFIFREEGVYTVTLEVSDALGGLDTGTLTVTVEAVQFALVVGPLVDDEANPVPGASVRITWGGQVFQGVTGASGLVEIEVDAGAIGSGVTVRVEKDGYETQEYGTTITSGRRLERSPDPMVLEEVAPPPSDGRGGFAAWEWAVLLPVLVVVLVILMYLFGGREGPPDRRPEERKG